MNDLSKETCLAMVKNSIREFVSNRPEIKIVDKVVGGCTFYSKWFLDYCPNLQGKLVHLIGHRNVLPNRHEYFNHYPNPDPSFYHTVVLFQNDIVVDMTYLQLDEKAESPRIMSLEELKLEWYIIAYDEKNIADDMCGYLHRTTKEAYEWWTSKIINGDIVLSGTEDSNPHIKHIHNTLKAIYAPLEKKEF